MNTSTSIEAELNEAKRDALVDFYLGHVIPAEKTTGKGYEGKSNQSHQKKPTLIEKIHTAEDLYEYLLIDPLVSNSVRTSKVAEGVASLQLYLNRLVQCREPHAKAMPDEVRRWQDNDSHYAVWAGNRALEAYPENYLNPTLRKSKTTLFKKLETCLNQGRINKDEAQSAVLDYLNGFEEISNLEVVSGYQARIEQMVYFIGRTKNKPHKYYWRSLNLAKHPDENEGKTFFPTAWSEWKPVDAAVGNAMDSLVCPVFMNGRLYIAWCESAEQEGMESATGQEAIFSASDGSKTQLVLDNPIRRQSGTLIKLAFKRFDDTWSVPLELKNLPADEQVVYFSAYVDVDQEKEELHLLVGLDTNAVGQSNVYKYDALLNDISTKDEIFDLSKLGEQAQEALKTLEAQKRLKILTAQKKQEALKAVKELNKLKGLKQEEGETIKKLRKALEKGDIKNILDGLVDLGQVVGKEKAKALLDELKTLREKEIETAAEERGAQGAKIVMQGHNSSERWGVILEEAKNISPRMHFTAKVVGESNAKKLEVKVEPLSRNDLLFRHKASHITIEIKDNKGNRHGNSLCSENNILRNNTIKFDITSLNQKKEYFNIEITTSIGFSKSQIQTLRLCLVPPKSYTQYLTIHSTEHIHSKSEFAQYLQFPDGMKYLPIRLNTLFAKKLVKKANIGIDAVLNWTTQGEILEPGLKADGEAVKMDFHGANGLYFWELFFHMPLLVAHRLNLEQRFADAMRWLHYLFLPSDIHGDYWRMQGLLEGVDGADAEMIAPGAVDPDELAMVHPVHYRKAVFFAYIKNLLDQGDACYRELTREALSEAKQWYLQARALLGQAPMTKVARKWEPKTLKTLVESHAPCETSVSGIFSLPLNKALHDYWQKVDNRLYNLRHSLTLDGKFWNPPLFEAPLNPLELLAARGRGGSGGARSMSTLQIPPLRFTAMMGKALNAVEMLIQFGNALQSTLERKDAAELERLQHVQQGELLGLTLEMQDLTIDMGKKTLEGLKLSKESAATRESYYQKLSNEYTSAAEDQVRVLRGTASGIAAGAPALRTAGAVASMVPNIYGTATGGSDFAGPFYAAADGLLCESEVISLLANQMEISEQYRRRAEEWKLQSELATSEVKQIDQQIAAQKQQLELFKKQKAQIKAQQTHLQANYAFLTSRFTAESLYQWMAGQLSALYFQAYDAVTSLCLLSEAAWRYEMGEYETPSFIQPGAWQDLYRGLLAGETLKLALHRMDQAYLTRNERRLEIVHTVSLKQLFESKNEDWASKLNGLKEEGVLTFDLTERDFDRRYPGHYLRQIITVSVSLPAVIGPYQDVRAILTQTDSHVIVKPDVDAVTQLLDQWLISSTAIKSNLRASQQIALSTGIDDSGLFSLNFGDERYLPFEGTGAVSSWTLTFPEHTDEAQQALLASLTDVIVCVRYTAKDGSTVGVEGGTFGAKVAELARKPKSRPHL